MEEHDYAEIVESEELLSLKSSRVSVQAQKITVIAKVLETIMLGTLKKIKKILNLSWHYSSLTKMSLSACKQHCMTHRRRIRFKKNDKRRVKAICKDCQCGLYQLHGIRRRTVSIGN